MNEYTKNSILLNFTPLTGFPLNNYVEVYVNNVLKHTEYSQVNLLYISPVVSGDIIKMVVKNLNFADQRIEIDINRVNYTTDANGDDNGITNTYITGVTGNVFTNTYTIDGYFANGTSDSYSYDLILDVNLPNFNFYDEGKYLLFSALNTGSTQGLGVSTNYGASITPVGPSINTISGSTIQFLRNGAISRFGNTMIVPSLYDTNTLPVTLGYMYKSSDFGSTWNPIYGLGNKGFDYCDLSSDGQIITTIDYINDKLYISNDSGTNWTTKSPSFTITSLTNGYSGYPQYFTTTFDYCYRLDSINDNFIPLTSLGTGNWDTISVSDDNKYIFVASQYVSSIIRPKFYISSDSGTTWTQTFTSYTSYTTNLKSSMDSSGKYILIGDVTNNKTFLSSNYGITFTQVLSDASDPYVSASGKYMYAIYPLNLVPSMRYSTDYGVTWSTRTYTPTITSLTCMTVNK